MLNFKDVTVRLGGRTILDRASAALPPGSGVGLIGRNGAGKSTLMRVIAGLAEADEGSIDMPRGSRIGYVAQDIHLFHGSVRENLGGVGDADDWIWTCLARRRSLRSWGASGPWTTRSCCDVMTFRWLAPGRPAAHTPWSAVMRLTPVSTP